jgi:hypothetical protein
VAVLPPKQVPGATAVPEGSVSEIAGQPNRVAVVSIGVTNTRGKGYFQLFDCATQPGGYANLNAAEAGQTIANLAMVEFDGQGKACVYNHTTADIFVDVQGYLDPKAFTAESRRLLDTRTRAAGAVDARQRVQFTGKPNGLAVVSLVATKSAARGYLQILPCADTAGEYSSINVDRAGQTIANLAIVQLDAGGRACVYSHGGSHVVVDLQGYIDPDSFEPVSRRLVDTRLPPGSTRPAPKSRVTVDGGRPGGLAIMSLIATQTLQRGYVQALPCTATAGAYSNLNTDRAGQTIANLAFVTLDNAGTTCLYTNGGAHLVGDLQGFLDSDVFTPVNKRIMDTRVR